MLPGLLVTPQKKNITERLKKWQRRREEQRREVKGAHLAHQTSFRCSFIRYFLGAYKMLGTEVTGTLLNKRDMVPALMMLIFYMTEDKE